MHSGETGKRNLSAEIRTALLAWLLLIVAFLSAPAQAQSQSKGDASIRLEYQFIHTDVFYDDAFLVGDYWSTDSHIGLLSGDYAFSDKWSMYAALPYVQKRFVPDPNDPYGGDPHNPNDPWWIDFVPPDKRFIDDGDYHGGFQDLSVGVRYVALEGPLTVTPYIGYGWPTDNYPFYAKAAIGTRLWNIPVGVDLMYIPYFSDWYFRGNVAYVFSEQPLDVNVDYWLGSLKAGYWFSPRFSVNGFMLFKYLRNGYVLPWSFTDDPTYGNYPVDFDTEEWWMHDRLLRNRYVNAGVGFDWFLNENYLLSGSYYSAIWSEQTNEVDYAFTLGLTYYFGGD